MIDLRADPDVIVSATIYRTYQLGRMMPPPSFPEWGVRNIFGAPAEGGQMSPNFRWLLKKRLTGSFRLAQVAQLSPAACPIWDASGTVYVPLRIRSCRGGSVGPEAEHHRCWMRFAERFGLSFSAMMSSSRLEPVWLNFERPASGLVLFLPRSAVSEKISHACRATAGSTKKEEDHHVTGSRSQAGGGG